jgi:hypothetical protein
MLNHRTFLAVAAALIATAAVAPSATAVLLPDWRPPGYRLVSQRGTATSYHQTFRRGANKIDYDSNYRRCDKALPGSPVHRIRVPSWVRVRTVVGSSAPSMFRYVYWTELTAGAEIGYDAWACARGRTRYGRYANGVYATSQGPQAAGPKTLARMIWSTVST